MERPNAPSRPTPLARTLAAALPRSADGAWTLGEAQRRMADGSVPVLLMLLSAVAALPSPGVPVGAVFGSAIVWLSLRALAGGGALPAVLARRRLPHGLMRAAIRRLLPAVRKAERLARPVLPVLAQGAGRIAVWLAIVLQGLLLALPIPFGNPLPALAIFALSGGLVRQDGAWVLAGYGLSAVSAGAAGLLAWAAVAALTPA